MVKKLINDPKVKIEVNKAMENEQIPEAKGTLSGPNTPTINNNAGISNNATNTSQITPKIAQTVETPDNRVTNIPVNTPETTPTPAPLQIQEPVKVEEPQGEVVLGTDGKYYKVKQAKPVEPKAETPVEAPKVETVKTEQPKVEFGYQTTPEQRDQRNQSIAQIILDSGKKFDSTTIANWIRTNAPGVSEADINNTVNEIFTRYQGLVKAKKTANKVSLPAKDLVNENLTTDDLNYLKQTDPNKYNEYIKLKDVKTTNDLLSGEKVEPPKEEIPGLPPVATIDLLQLREQTYGTAEFKESKSKVSKIADELNKIQQDIEDVYGEVEKQYYGTGASRGEIVREANRRIEDYKEQYKYKKREYDTALSEYTMLKDDADSIYNTTIEQYNINRQTASDAFEQMKYQYGLIQEEMAMRNEAIKSDIEWERKKEFLGLESKIKSEQSYIDYLQDLSKMEIENGYDEKKGILDYKRDLAKLGIQNAYDINKSNLSYQQDLGLEKLKNTYANDRDVQNYIRDIEKLKFQYEYSPENIQKTLEMQNYNQFMGNGGGLLSILGNGKVTGYGGDYDNNFGLDVDGNVGDPIFGFEGTVIGTGSDAKAGQYIKIKLDDGKEVMLSHLNRANVKDGQRVKATDVIAEIGNTGNVLKMNGQKPTAEELKQGFGSHIDIRIKENGVNIKSSEIENYLRAYNPMKTSELTASQMQQIENLKGDYYSKSGIQTLGQAGITQEMLNDYLQKQKEGPQRLDSNQRIIWNSTKSAFESNPQVKAFEETLGQSMNLLSSLNDESGPGDIAAIFQFMKSLDPQSVVRESEFEVAAKSAGVWEYMKNTLPRLEKGKLLTPEQRKAFGKLSKVFVANKAKTYNRLYDNMVRVLDSEGISRSYAPTNAAKDLDKYLGTSFKDEYAVTADELDTAIISSQNTTATPYYDNFFNSVLPQ